MPSLTLYNLQQEILKYFQGKAVNEDILPATSVEELGIYKSLVISSAEDYIERVFSNTAAVIGPRFREFIKDYLEQYPSKSPLFFMLAKDFSQFIAGDFCKTKYDPPNFLGELALSEWTEVEMQNSTNLAKRSRLNPIHKILKQKFPISQLKQLISSASEEELEELRHADVDEEEEISMIFRDPISCKTRFFNLSPASLSIITDLDNGCDEQETFNNLIENFCLADTPETRSEFENLLIELKKNQILLE